MTTSDESAKSPQLKGRVSLEKRGDIAILWIENPPVNALSSGVRQGLYDHLGELAKMPSLKAVVLTGVGRTFIAGADITEFGGQMAGASLGSVLARIESFKKPVLAAINGAALGGGLEVALCCHYRLAAKASRLGLPEVNLGLLPGAGGTQRLPRLAGAEAALQIMLGGVPISPDAAKKMGIVDAVTDGDPIQACIDHAGQVEAQGAFSLPLARSASQHLESDRAGLDRILAQARAMAGRRRRGQEAPLRIIECVKAAILEDDFEAGLETERKLFMDCLNSPQRGAMIHFFFAERQAAKIPGLGKEAGARDIKSAAVVGAGLMGGGIAMCLAEAGIAVKLLDKDLPCINRGLVVVAKNYRSQVERGRITEEQMQARMAKIVPEPEIAKLGDADIIIEAVYENLDLKKEIFAKLDQYAKKGAILASNTSALDIDALAKVTSRPKDVVGTHFFSPANVMRLLEVVKGEATASDVLASAMRLGKRLRKVAVMAGNCRGFIGNRMLAKYTEQASQLILEGAMPREIDAAMRNFGMAMGPFQMADLVGLDLGWRARKMSGTKSKGSQIVVDALCELGHYGQKTGSGYYLYEFGTRQPRPHPAADELVRELAAKSGLARQIDEREIVDRLVLALVNEGALILEEKIAVRASDIDVVYVYGYGFPVWRGGPMYYANQLGTQKAASRIAELAKASEQAAAFWQVAPLLEKLAKGALPFS